MSTNHYETFRPINFLPRNGFFKVLNPPERGKELSFTIAVDILAGILGLVLTVLCALGVAYGVTLLIAPLVVAFIISIGYAEIYLKLPLDAWMPQYTRPLMHDNENKWRYAATAIGLSFFNGIATALIRPYRLLQYERSITCDKDARTAELRRIKRLVDLWNASAVIANRQIVALHHGLVPAAQVNRVTKRLERVHNIVTGAVAYAEYLMDEGPEGTVHQEATANLPHVLEDQRAELETSMRELTALLAANTEVAALTR